MRLPKPNLILRFSCVKHKVHPEYSRANFYPWSPFPPRPHPSVRTGSWTGLPSPASNTRSWPHPSEWWPQHSHTQASVGHTPASVKHTWGECWPQPSESWPHPSHTLVSVRIPAATFGRVLNTPDRVLATPHRVFTPQRVFASKRGPHPSEC